LQFYKVSDDTLISSSTDSIFSIFSVDVQNRKLTVTGTATGITALDAALPADPLNIYFNTSHGKQMAGLIKILTNTGSLFGIDASEWELWSGNTVSIGGQMTLSKLLNALAIPAGRGLDEKVTCFLNDRTWANVASDQAALRKYDARYDEERAKNGFRALTFYSQNGEIELIPWNCMKEGEAIAIPLKQVKRIGSTDITFSQPGGNEKDPTYFRELADSAGFEYRCYSGQAIFIVKPARCLYMSGIVNS
jgi:hypothetical protein